MNHYTATPPRWFCDKTGFVVISNLTPIDECNETIYTPFDSDCSAERRNGTYDSRGLDFIFKGTFFFNIPRSESESTVWIDRVS